MIPHLGPGCTKKLSNVRILKSSIGFFIASLSFPNHSDPLVKIFGPFQVKARKKENIFGQLVEYQQGAQ